jgi:hypothetical protein
MDASAHWKVYPGADLERVSDLLRRLAEELGWDGPPEIIDGQAVLLPLDKRVFDALDKLKPDWRDTLLRPPPPPPPS